jgi:hypothetical protein
MRLLDWCIILKSICYQQFIYLLCISASILAFTVFYEHQITQAIIRNKQYQRDIYLSHMDYMYARILHGTIIMINGR